MDNAAIVSMFGSADDEYLDSPESSDTDEVFGYGAYSSSSSSSISPESRSPPCGHRKPHQRSAVDKGRRPEDARVDRAQRAKRHCLTETTSHPTGCMLPPEDAEGNVEYKLKLVDPSESRFQHLVTQMKWRLREGQGEAIYEIGVEDGGLVVGLSPSELEASLNTLYRMADKLDADVSILRERVIMGERKSAEVLVRRVPDDQRTIELRTAVLGHVDAGKSTLLGVLTQGDLDNGRGRARLNLFRHLHEIQTGHTSSISREILGFDSVGNPLTYKHYRTAEEICDHSSKVITFIDLAGHQKFLKTTHFGLTGHSPHYGIVVVSAACGLAGTARDHLELLMGLQLPVIVVINKIDAVSKNTLLNTLGQVERTLQDAGMQPIEIMGEDDVLPVAQSLGSNRVCPIFMVSCVSGAGLNLLYAFFNVLPTRCTIKERETLMRLPTVFQIDETFDVPDVGLVAAGLLTQGLIREGDVLLAGPDYAGAFQRVRVASLQRNRVACRMVRAGESATLALNVERPQAIRRGTVLCVPRGKPTVGRLFQAHVRLLSCDGDDPVKVGFHATVQVGNVQQGAVVAGIKGRTELGQDETALVTLRLVKQPECMSLGSSLVFHRGGTRGIGVLKKVYPLTPMETDVMAREE